MARHTNFVDNETVIMAEDMNGILGDIQDLQVAKVDKEAGKGLSKNDFTDALKSKLDGIDAEADKTVFDTTLTQAGQAADAEATGIVIGNIKSAITSPTSTILTFEQNAISKNNGGNSSTGGTKRVRTPESKAVNVQMGYTLTVPAGFIATVFYYAYSASGTTYVGYADDITGEYTEDEPQGNRVRVMLQNTSDTDITPSDVTSPVVIDALPVTDKSLTVYGKAADAGQTGFEIGVVNKSLTDCLPDGIEAAAGFRAASFVKGYYETPAVGEVSNYVSDATGMICAKLPVTSSDFVEFCGYGSASAQRLYAILDADGKALMQTSANTSGVKRPNMASYPTAAFIIVNSRRSYTDKTYLFVGPSLAQKTDDLSASVGNIVDRLTVPFTNYIQKNVASTTGKLSNTNAEYYITSEGLLLLSDISFATAGGSQLTIYCYDENGAFLGTIGNWSGTTYNDYQIQTVLSREAGTVYVRFRFGSSTEPINVDEWEEDGVSLILYKSSENDNRNDDEDGIPSYYNTDRYLKNKIDSVIARRNGMSLNSDSFFFITDYHVGSNQNHSPALIRYISKCTGITKLFSGGDVGRKGRANDRWFTAKEDAQVFDMLEHQVTEAYGVLGNHEWSDSAPTYSKAGTFALFLDRYKTRVTGMDAENGYYWIDNPVNKIRYYFVQDTVGAAPVGRESFAEHLKTVPSGGWSVAVVIHHGFIPGIVTKDEYGGVEIDTTKDSHVLAHVISKALGGFQSHSVITYRIAGVDYSHDYTGTDGHAIGVFCGHLHHGSLYSKFDEHNADSVTVFRGSTDTLWAASIEVDNLPWYWEGGVIGGTKVVREAGTINEQCFYIVQLDMDAQIGYITTIGGDNDYVFSFGDDPLPVDPEPDEPEGEDEDIEPDPGG